MLEDSNGQGSGTGIESDGPSGRIPQGIVVGALEHDRARCVHHLLENSAGLTPDRVAVSVGGTTRTFAEARASVA